MRKFLLGLCLVVGCFASSREALATTTTTPIDRIICWRWHDGGIGDLFLEFSHDPRDPALINVDIWEYDPQTSDWNWMRQEDVFMSVGTNNYILSYWNVWIRVPRVVGWPVLSANGEAELGSPWWNVPLGCERRWL